MLFPFKIIQNISRINKNCFNTVAKYNEYIIIKVINSYNYYFKVSK